MTRLRQKFENSFKYFLYIKLSYTVTSVVSPLPVLSEKPPHTPQHPDSLFFPFSSRATHGSTITSQHSSSSQYCTFDQHRKSVALSKRSTSPPCIMSEGSEHVNDVVIIGSGPAAHTAAIYLARAELHPILFEGFLAGGIAAGGQLTTTLDVENFPGFQEGILGPVLVSNFRQQSLRFGTKVITETVNSVDLSARPFVIKTEFGTSVSANSLIVATGASARRLDIPGCRDGEYWQKGVSACAVCDGAAPIFRNAVVAVIGGGDSAVEEACFLTKYAQKVYMVHRRDTLRASKIMQRRAIAHPKVDILYSHVVVEAKGNGNILQNIVLLDLKTDVKREIKCGGLFFAVGHEPNVGFLSNQLQVDKQNYIVTKPDSTQTSVPGVFAAGDVQDKKWRQAVTAAGTGCMAALEVEAYLTTIHDEEHEQADDPTAHVDGDANGNTN